jgi:small subunit ribosomal protein S1
MGRQVENKSIKKRNPTDKVFCDEPYAQEVYEKYCDYFEGKKISAKDMDEGDICRAQVISIKNNKVLVQAENTQAVYLDLLKESKFLDKQGITEVLRPGMFVDVLVDGTDKGTYTGSMEKAFGSKIKKELMAALKNKDSAFKVEVKSINEGGFIVDLAGLDCFMPGSLAAANKIVNFESMIGKEIYVMVENYLEASDMFVVSNKKYIQSILPTKVKELDFGNTYTGTVTGVMTYGAFIEWDDIFTGLLHESESEGSNIKGLKPGDSIQFWVKEVREGKDIRIILTQKGPSAEHKLYQEFKDKYEDEIYANAKVKDIKPFGVFIEMKDGIVGMLSPREFKKIGPKYKEEDIIDVFVKQVDVGTKRVHLKAISDED